MNTPLSAALVVDGPNWAHAFESVNGRGANFSDLCGDLEKAISRRMGTPVRFLDKVLVSPRPDRSYPNYQGLLSFHAALRHQGWRVEWTDRGCDDALVVEELTDLAGWCRVLVLGSGDGHFASTVRSLRHEYGVRVAVASTNRGRRARYGTAPDLRRSASVFVELGDLPSVRSQRFEWDMDAVGNGRRAVPWLTA